MWKYIILVLAISVMSRTVEAGIFLKNCRDGSVYSENFIVYLQEALKTDGVYKGKADGKLGPATRAAFTAYRKKHGLPQADGIDLPLLQSLLSADFDKIASRDFRLAACSKLLSGRKPPFY